MNRKELFGEITRTYQKFGWKLRRVLLNDGAQSDSSQEKLSIPENVIVEKGLINALWFSRASGAHETWELRLLSASPFALLENFDASVPESEREKRRAIMVEKLQLNPPKFDV